MDKFVGGVVGHFGGGGGASTAGDAVAGTNYDEALVLSDGSVRRAALGSDGLPAMLPRSAASEHLRAVRQSQMAGMLRDGGRNAAFQRAIDAVVAAAAGAAGGKAGPHVLDVGAGTGLLSLMALRAGAGLVTAVEQWPVMAALARDVAAANGASGDRMQVHATHSSKLRGAMRGAAGVVVSEIVDSCLLGEAIIPTLRHAFQHLAQPALPPQRVVPYLARLHARLLHCPHLTAWHAVDAAAAAAAGIPLTRSEDGAPIACEATSPALPVHWSGLQRLFGEACAPASPTFPLAAMDFTPAGVAAFDAAQAAAEAAAELPEAVRAVPSASLVPCPGGEVRWVPAASGARPATAVVYWWQMHLCHPDVAAAAAGRRDVPRPAACWSAGVDAAGSDAAVAECVAAGVPVYCTCPVCIEDAAVEGWQDHWVQCIMPLPTPVEPAPAAADGGGGFTVVALHTEQQVRVLVAPGGAAVWPSKRMWKRAQKRGVVPAWAAAPHLPRLFTELEPCSCGVHAVTSYERRWQLGAGAGVDGGFLSDSAQRCAGFVVAAGSAHERHARSSGGGDDDDGDDAFPAAAGGAGSADDAGASLQGRRAIVTLGQHSLLGLATAAAINAAGLGERLQVVALDDGEAEVVQTTAVAEAAGLEDVLTVVQLEAAHAGAAGLVEQVAALVSLPSLAGVLVEPTFARMQHLPVPCALAAWLRGASLAAAAAVAGARAPLPVVPGVARVRAQPISVPSLARSHGPVGGVCGFDHGAFDAAEADWHTHTFTYPLWQYEWRAAGATVTLAALSPHDAALVAAVQQLAGSGGGSDGGAGVSESKDAGGGGGHGAGITLPATATLLPDVTADAVMVWVDWYWEGDGDGDGKDGASSTHSQPWLSTHPAAAPWSRQHVRFLPPALAGTVASGGRGALSVALHLSPAAAPGAGEGGLEWDVVVGEA
jgi:SAM-dependent methyltransferase